MRRSEVSQHHLKNLISCAIKFSRYFFFPVRACVLVLIVCLRDFFCVISLRLLPKILPRPGMFNNSKSV